MADDVNSRRFSFEAQSCLEFPRELISYSHLTSVRRKWFGMVGEWTPIKLWIKVDFAIPCSLYTLYWTFVTDGLDASYTLSNCSFILYLCIPIALAAFISLVFICFYMRFQKQTRAFCQLQKIVIFALVYKNLKPQICKRVSSSILASFFIYR